MADKTTYSRPFPNVLEIRTVFSDGREFNRAWETDERGYHCCYCLPSFRSDTRVNEEDVTPAAQPPTKEREP